MVEAGKRRPLPADERASCGTPQIAHHEFFRGGGGGGRREREAPSEVIWDRGRGRGTREHGIGAGAGSARRTIYTKRTLGTLIRYYHIKHSRMQSK